MPFLNSTSLRKYSIIFLLPSKLWMSWQSSFIFPWNIIRECIWHKSVLEMWSTLISSASSSITYRFYAELSVFTNDFFFKISCSQYLWPDATVRIWRAVVSKYLRLCLLSVKTANLGSDIWTRFIVRDFTIYKPTQLIEEPSSAYDLINNPT